MQTSLIELHLFQGMFDGYHFTRRPRIDGAGTYASPCFREDGRKVAEQHEPSGYGDSNPADHRVARAAPLPLKGIRIVARISGREVYK
ncbi:hypothetical protein [Roseimaritima multifibrata]|uniref:hypothetical protein n=1 Tax=Roseimaritima multifibrata TaxID=1930274 RepID=UPI0011A9927E|nr:hypothetical protein [Roseimaritima multifibrata]